MGIYDVSRASFLLVIKSPFFLGVCVCVLENYWATAVYIPAYKISESSLPCSTNSVSLEVVDRFHFGSG